MAPAPLRPPRGGLGFYGPASWGAQVEGSSGVSAIKLGAYLRRNTTDRPYGVVNDYVASKLGSLIGLPVPAGELIETYGGKYGYMSLAFSNKGDRPPPIIPATFAADRPWEASGIVAFDQWVLNTDRHDENLAYLPSSGVAVFDHDLSLLNTYSGSDVDDFLVRVMDNELKDHILTQHLRSAEHLHEWCKTISHVNERVISRTVYTCYDAGLIEASVRDALIRLLLHRQRRSKSFISRTRGEYVRISSWPLEDGEVDSGS